jgi:hypothetical protein
MGPMGEPFAVDEDAALSAFALVWGSHYQVWLEGATWYAHYAGAPDDESLTGTTPDEISREIRRDWSRRNPEPPHGPGGMPPS